MYLLQISGFDVIFVQQIEMQINVLISLTPVSHRCLCDCQMKKQSKYRSSINIFWDHTCSMVLYLLFYSRVERGFIFKMTCIKKNMVLSTFFNGSICFVVAMFI